MLLVGRPLTTCRYHVLKEEVPERGPVSVAGGTSSYYLQISRVKGGGSGERPG